MSLIWIIFIGISLLSWIVQANLNRKFKKFSEIPVGGGMTGRDVAERMLQAHGIHDVKITCIEGRLTDHYNPADNTVNLSREVYSSCSVAAAAVAAHECGHAVQHATAYGPLKMRSALVPAVSFASKWVSWILLVGIMVVERFPGLLLFGILLFATTTLFSFITLPVEINASQRALAWLDRSGVTSSYNQRDAESALRSAAYTYVVAALSSLATLVYYVMIYLGRRD
jgi:Zn-dependent membrane protease YugP